MPRRVARGVDRVLGRYPLYPFLFVVAVVLPLWVTNFGEAPAAHMAVLLAVVLAATAAGYMVAWVLFRDVRRAAIVVTAVSVLSLKLGQLNTAAGALWNVGPIVVLSMGIGLIVVVAVAAAKARSQRMVPFTQAANLASVVLLGWVALPLAGSISDALSTPPGLPSDSSWQVAVHTEQTTGPQRDIYFVVLDRYGSERALETGFGISNAEFVGWLRTQGFEVSDDARANFVSTPLSLGTSLSMTGIDDIAEQVGPDFRSLAPVVERVRQSRVGAFLQDRGYEYVHIGTWYDPTRVSLIADRSLAPEGHTWLGSVAFESSALGVIQQVLAPERSYLRLHADAAEYAFDQLGALLEEPDPTFVVAHILMPHPPYVFLEDGTYDPGSATLESQLRYTNDRVRTFVTAALGQPEERRPIIVLQADEGPYPPRYERDPNSFDWAAASDEEIAVKFGILSALYLPGPEGAAPVPSTLSPVNTFREVLRRYFGADLVDAPDRSYASPYLRPYDLTDVTARLGASDAVEQAATASTIGTDTSPH